MTGRRIIIFKGLGACFVINFGLQSSLSVGRSDKLIKMKEVVENVNDNKYWQNQFGWGRF